MVNRTSRSEWREVGRIVARNVFTAFNAMVAPAAVALFLLGEKSGGIAVSGMAITNTLLGLIQEIRAKRQLDKLAILVETRVQVRRDGLIREIPSSQVVQDDCILLESGAAVVADGPLVEAHFLEVDEALLTGESDPVRRAVGERVLSGSYCVAGAGAYRAEHVGEQAFAGTTAREARRYHHRPSPLTRVVNTIVAWLSYTAITLCGLYLVAAVLQGWPLAREVEIDLVNMVAATITSMVPQGLVLTATVSFTMGAVVMSRRGAIVQDLHAVETMAGIDVICTDKTGTLTTNMLRVKEFVALDPAMSPDEVMRKLHAFTAATIDQRNKNIQALADFIRGEQIGVETIEQVPFKSSNRYSAVRVRVDGGEHLFVLGAPEALQRYVEGRRETPLTPNPSPLSTVERGENLKPLSTGTPGERGWGEGAKSPLNTPLTPVPSPLSIGERGEVEGDYQTRLDEWREAGTRVLLFAQADAIPLGTSGALPDIKLTPLALIALQDEMRPDAQQVIAALAAQGIAFKVISGDNPDTVKATLRQGHISLGDLIATGDELARSHDPADLIRRCNIFGRVAPEQKVLIVSTLQKAGLRVAMIGDGVNDVLSIKKADLGIAMGAGSQATKTVAGLILQGNDFARLPETLEEGRTIVRNLRRAAKLFLVKNVYSLILIVVYFVHYFRIPFPYVPQQVTLLNWLVIGIPALIIALSRERAKIVAKTGFLREVGSFAIRSGVCIGIVGVVALTVGVGIDPGDEEKQRTLLLSVLILSGIIVLWRGLRDGESVVQASDRRLGLLALLAIPAYLVAMYWPVAATFFELRPLRLMEWVIVVGLSTVGYALCDVSDKLVRGRSP